MAGLDWEVQQTNLAVRGEILWRLFVGTGRGDPKEASLTEGPTSQIPYKGPKEHRGGYLPREIRVDDGVLGGPFFYGGGYLQTVSRDPRVWIGNL